MHCLKSQEISLLEEAVECKIDYIKSSMYKKVDIASIDILNSAKSKLSEFRCPDKVMTPKEMSRLPLKERIKYARMVR